MNASGLVGMPNKFVANLPYAVAATLVLDYFQRFAWLESATVMVQKEVADRMAAHPGSKDYGAFTVKLSLHARPSGRFAVGPNNFFPPPRVDSAVLRLDRSTPLDEAGRPLDAAVVRAAATMADAAFANRRKTLANSCKTYFAGKGEGGHAGCRRSAAPVRAGVRRSTAEGRGAADRRLRPPGQGACRSGRVGKETRAARRGTVPSWRVRVLRHGLAVLSQAKAVTAFNVKLWLPIDNFPVHERERSHRRQMVSKSLQYWGASVQIL